MRKCIPWTIAFIFLNDRLFPISVVIQNARFFGRISIFIKIMFYSHLLLSSEASVNITINFTFLDTKAERRKNKKTRYGLAVRNMDGK